MFARGKGAPAVLVPISFRGLRNASERARVKQRSPVATAHNLEQEAQFISIDHGFSLRLPNLVMGRGLHAPKAFQGVVPTKTLPHRVPTTPNFPSRWMHAWRLGATKAFLKPRNLRVTRQPAAIRDWPLECDLSAHPLLEPYPIPRNCGTVPPYSEGNQGSAAHLSRAQEHRPGVIGTLVHKARIWPFGIVGTYARVPRNTRPGLKERIIGVSGTGLSRDSRNPAESGLVECPLTLLTSSNLIRTASAVSFLSLKNGIWMSRGNEAGPLKHLHTACIPRNEA